jgi:hypothetical protein
MSSRDLALKLARWTREMGVHGPVAVRRDQEAWLVEFESTTTKSRASSLKTRIHLLASRICGDLETQSGVELLGERPRLRSDLSKWRIFVNIPMRRKRTDPCHTK